MALNAGILDKQSVLKHALAGDSAALDRVISDDSAEAIVATSVTAATFVATDPDTVTDLATLLTALETLGLIVDGS